jgi:cation:H+ antiporter
VSPVALWLAGLAVGLVVLAWSADRFVDGAAALAANLGVQPLVVGLVVVGFGTSAPELLVSALAAWDGRGALGLGNAVGSNIANVALIVGVAALVRPLVVRSVILRRELPVPLAAMLLCLVLLLDDRLGRAHGAALLAVFALVLWLTVRVALRERRRPAADSITAEYAASLPSGVATGRALVRIAVGLVLLLVASRLLVWSAAGIAGWWGLSDLVIGLTVVAIGTSLPELAASVAAARKGQPDIALGNVLGSNTFNTLVAVGIVAVIDPGPVDRVVLTRDFPVMIGLMLALFVMAYGFGRQGRITRAEGATLVLAFAGYLALLLRTIPA